MRKQQIWLWIIASFILTTCTTASDADRPVYIATSANLQFAMEALVKNFQAMENSPCEIIVNASGKLSAQIKAGAPYDIFLSADRKYPQELWLLGLSEDQPETYAFGKLVLWSSLPFDTLNVASLQDERVQFIALANPKTAPYGRAAKEVLEKNGLWEAIQTKLVMGESIAQTNQFLLSGAAQIGFTAQSVVLASQMSEKGQWQRIADSLYTPIRQDVLLLKDASAEAKRFYDFLFTEEAQQLLSRFGYELPDKKSIH